MYHQTENIVLIRHRLKCVGIENFTAANKVTKWLIKSSVFITVGLYSTNSVSLSIIGTKSSELLDINFLLFHESIKAYNNLKLDPIL